MKLPLNAAILQQFLFHDELQADEIYQYLAPNYSAHRQYTLGTIEHSLQAAMFSGLLDESRLEERGGKVYTWYSPTEVGLSTIKRFVGEG